jgi:hypothetical protein
MRALGLGSIVAVVIAWSARASADEASAPVSPPGPASTDVSFDFHGYFRAPLRIGVGHRPQCPAGATSATPNTATSPAIMPSTDPPFSAQYSGQYCAVQGQSRTAIHSPYVPDDQMYAWTYDRQWEQALAELYLSYGNRYVFGTVGMQAYNFTDTSLLGNQADPAQFGISQAWLTVAPDLPVAGLGVIWKVGAFSEKFGMAGRHDAGPYDTYMFGRTHQIGESLTLEYGLGDWTFRVEHGFGAHLEMVPTGIALSGSGFQLDHYDSMVQSTYQIDNPYPPAASAGFTLLDHAHVGVEWKDRFVLNGHYLVAWSHDDRAQATLMGNGNPSGPYGSMTVLGGEARLLGGFVGDLYLGYSHIDTRNVTIVGPAIEVLHSAGGGGHNSLNGIYDNFYGSSGDGDGHIDTVQAGYDFSLAALLRKIRSPDAPPWAGDGPDLKLSVFAMASAVGAEPASVSPFSGHRPIDGTVKLKYGADFLANVLPWFGFGVRADYVQPDSHDAYQSFGVVSPRLVFRTAFVTHEEITAQYSHYWDGVEVLPQQYLAETGYRFLGASFGSLYPNDADVFGLKVTMAW